MPADLLRTRVFTLCRRADHTLGELAQELALHPKVLSRKLNQSGGARLTLAERKRLIMTLARWQALTTRQETLALMELLELPPTTFSLIEWAAAPLALLEATVQRSSFPEYPTSQTVLPQHNLPAPMTRLIGRESAVEQVRQLLQQPDIRLVTLLGPGGTGKTRLALPVAGSLIGHRSDGVAFVPLAGVTDPALVVPTIAQTLGVKDAAGSTPLALLITYLRAKELLLVLDNCEQVLEAAQEIGELLVQVAGLTVLGTSRAALQLYGEQEWSVPPLDVPNMQHRPLTVDLLQQFTAVQLFMERRGYVGVAVYNLDDGALYSFQGTRTFAMYSTAKVPIMLAVLNRAVREDRRVTAREQRLINAMITASDNNAATTLYADIGGAKAVNSYLRKIGINNTYMDPGSWGYSTTTTQDMARLMAKLGNCTILVERLCNYGIATMQQVVRSQHWGVSAGVPDAASVALKNGWFPSNGGWGVNSIGLVRSGGKHYAIAVLTSPNPSMDYGIQTIERISTEVYTALP